jgi:antitoxin HicB
MEKVKEYTVLYRQEGDVIVAEVPAIPGCFADGHTVEEARGRVRDAILNFMDELTEAGEPLPQDEPRREPGPSPALDRLRRLRDSSGPMPDSSETVRRDRDSGWGRDERAGPR